MISIEAARVNAHLTQEEMAAKLNISVRTYAKYENYAQDMRISEVQRFCEIVKLEAAQIKFLDNGDKKNGEV